MTSSTDLASLLCSRLCHDLMSPVGAIGNGLELLADETDPAMRQSVVDLLEQSARSSAVKLQFYRFAYGSPAALGESVPVAEPRALLEALLADNGKVTLDWAVEAEALDRPAMKILLNFAAIGMTALVRGGTLLVGAEQRPGDDVIETEIVVRAAGPRIAFDPAIGSALDGELGDDELAAHTAPAFLVRRIAEELNGTVQHAVSDEALLLGAVLGARVAVE
jgi:histidine phosphotransferase ChpT